MPTLSVKWGTLSIILDNPKFQQAYQHGREHYFGNYDDSMTTEQVMRLIAIPDGNGSFQFDDKHAPLEELLGFALGFLSGPWTPGAEDEQQCESYYVQHTEPLSIVALQEV